MYKKGSAPQVAASILAGDFGHLADEARRIEESGANILHIDVMDGLFVPNITMGPQAVAAINRATEMFLEVHMMIYNPYDYVERFVEAGADRLIFHIEATEDVEETLTYIKRCNVQVGLAFNPETPASMIPKYLDASDLILIMTVHPGHGGQAFIPKTLKKISATREICSKLNISRDIEVDGGINEETARECVHAGANILVAGTYLFQQKVMADGVHALRNSKV